MFPQLPSPVTRVMNDLAHGLHKILGERLVAVYLGGSVASGDYADATSDLDFLVVIDGVLSQEDGLAVALLHRDLRKRHPIAARLEGDYAPLGALVPEGTSMPVPGCEGGHFLPRVGEIMLSADNISDMRAHGLVFHGPPAVQVLPAVTEDDVRSAVRVMLMDGPGAPATPREVASEVLNLVRSLCALETGMPTTKSEGARWGLSRLDSRWHPVIKSALAVRHGTGTREDEQLILQELHIMDESLRHLYVN